MTASPSDPALENFRTIAGAIATLFYPHAEVVLHDLRSQKVDYIANNLSKREIGDDLSLEDMLSEDISERNIGPYEKLNWDGQKIRSLSSGRLQGQERVQLCGQCAEYGAGDGVQAFEGVEGLRFVLPGLTPSRASSLPQGILGA
ncbi:YheO-like PAS domain-containing protein [Pseudomonas sp. NFACC52]|nr:YheO-like PAS domain-containing protein [Pseudomonas sp. NFACC56-3]SFK80316.1 YheO-like PAS domain-containing protein [Pseudomonas sp. NFACC52]